MILTELAGMSIEIKGYTQKNPVDTTATTSPGSKVGGQPADTARYTDRVTLSDAALQMGKMESSPSNIPVFDSQRVATLKQAINDHSYTIEPERIAEKFQRLGKALQGGM